ncbi:MAG: hypothetical protein M1305_07395, partial [Candidatus Marsarchaeota archaeon]|nr:hypothetical protein [Candidatus Marsarchaeota archaeon]
KRILVDGEWALDVTPKEYLGHLRTAARDPEAHRVVHVEKDGRLRLGFFVANRVPPDRLGKNSKPYLWIVYLVDYGTIGTGFQTMGIDEIHWPKVVRWL